ncbi:FkbM family methyltransferase [Halobellus sp. GM3]|uniref:FkbM family methyltransferase n=1 Tax=Halobellus sp. GM3 TaxID=3458410 RepID=UPI00403D6CF5
MRGQAPREWLRSRLDRRNLRNAVQRAGLDAHARRLYVALYRLRYGGAVPIDIGPATASIEVESAAELDNVVSIRGKERPVARTIVEELAPGDVFWDVGANVGTFSSLAGDVIETGAVVAFEPYPPNVERLRHNLQRNGVRYAIEPRALADSDGEETFFVMRTDAAGTREGSIDGTYAPTDDAVRTLTVETTTGDSVVAAGEQPPPDVVKIDVEGAAPDVIAGMRDTFDRSACRLVVVEPHDNANEIRSRLDEAGFRTRTLRVEGASRIVGSRS